MKVTIICHLAAFLSLTTYTVLLQIVVRTFVSFQQLFTPATKQDQQLHETCVH